MPHRRCVNVYGGPGRFRCTFKQHPTKETTNMKWVLGERVFFFSVENMTASVCVALAPNRFNAHTHTQMKTKNAEHGQPPEQTVIHSNQPQSLLPAQIARAGRNEHTEYEMKKATSSKSEDWCKRRFAQNNRQNVCC